jgi:hypothetical protein
VPGSSCAEEKEAKDRDGEKQQAGAHGVSPSR